MNFKASAGENLIIFKIKHTFILKSSIFYYAYTKWHNFPKLYGGFFPPVFLRKGSKHLYFIKLKALFKKTFKTLQISVFLETGV